MANYRGSEINNEALGDEMHGFYGIERAPELFHALMPATFKFQGRGVVGALDGGGVEAARKKFGCRRRIRSARPCKGVRRAKPTATGYKESSQCQIFPPVPASRPSRFWPPAC